MYKRRLGKAGLPPSLPPRSLRVAAITNLPTQGVPLEDVQNLANHADPGTASLYDQQQRQVTRNSGADPGLAEPGASEHAGPMPGDG